MSLISAFENQNWISKNEKAIEEKQKAPQKASFEGVQPIAYRPIKEATTEHTVAYDRPICPRCLSKLVVERDRALPGASESNEPSFLAGCYLCKRILDSVAYAAEIDRDISECAKNYQLGIFSDRKMGIEKSSFQILIERKFLTTKNSESKNPISEIPNPEISVSKIPPSEKLPLEKSQPKEIENASSQETKKHQSEKCEVRATPKNVPTGGGQPALLCFGYE